MAHFKCFLSAPAQNGGHYVRGTSFLQFDFNAQIDVRYLYFTDNQSRSAGQTSQVVANDEKQTKSARNICCDSVISIPS